MASTVGPSGQYNALCDVCGFKKKNWELHKRWDGYMVCREDWEPRHPLDFYRTRNDVHPLPWTRPDNDGIELVIDYLVPDLGVFCTVTGITNIVGQAIVGCAQVQS